jgi:hypothetical protein
VVAVSLVCIEPKDEMAYGRVAGAVPERG